MRRRETPLILAIDDTEANRFVVTGILRKAGYAVVEASTGKEALEQLAKHRPDLVIADVRLPDTTGFEIARKLRGSSRDTVPLLFISASFTGPGAYIQGLESGADGYLTHPLDAGVLLATVRSLLRIRNAEDVERFLADASDRFSRSLDQDDVARDLVAIATERVADACVVCQIGADGPRIIALAHAAPEKVEALRAVFVEHPPRLESGDLIAVPFQQTGIQVHALTDARGAALRQLGLATAVTAPLIARGNVFGSVTFYSHAKKIDDGTVRMFVDVANRAAMAADNARLFRMADEARKEAQIANSAKMDFLAAMSHELRTPLNAIAGYVDLLTLRIRGPLTREQEDDLARITQNQRHLSSLIEDILNYARLEAGRLTFNIERVSIADALTEVARLVASSYEAKGVRLSVKAHPELQAMADVDRLRQVLLNLLGNAVKFTARGGAVELAAEQVDAVIRISCTDTGRGIPPEKLEAIFEPFVQVVRSFTEEREGLGLGLAISRDLMRGMHGDLTVTSEVGKGSCFVLTLPVAVPNAAAAEPLTRSG